MQRTVLRKSIGIGIGIVLLVVCTGDGDLWSQTRAPLECGQPIDGKIDPGANASYQFSLRDGEAVSVSAYAFRAAVSIVDADGDRVWAPADGPVPALEAETGYSLLAVGTSPFEGDYRMQLHYLNVHESRGNECKTALTCGERITNELGSGHHDLFEFTLSEGEVASFSLTTFRTAAEILDASGQVVSAVASGAVVALDPGVPHFLRVRNTTGSPGNYRVEFGVINPSDERPESCRASIRCGETAEGTVAVAEHDLLEFSIHDGQAVSLSIEARFTELVLLDRTGQQVWAPEDGAVPALDGEASYFFKISNPGGLEGRYSIDLSCTPGVTFLRGDANASGTLDLTDGIVILTYLFRGGPDPVCFDALDADDNGMVLVDGTPAGIDLSDSVFIFRSLFLTGVPLPAPSAACGYDPTPDSLSCEEFASCP